MHEEAAVFAVEHSSEPVAGERCYPCGGTGRCWICAGTGNHGGQQCGNCWGSGKCPRCAGSGSAMALGRRG